MTRIICAIERQAGIVAFDAARIDNEIVGVITYDSAVIAHVQAEAPHLDIAASIEELASADLFSEALYLSCHSRHILTALEIEKFSTTLNVHPYLDRYPGANPVGRAIAAGTWREAAVFAHRMTVAIDQGPIIAIAKKRLNDRVPLTIESVYCSLYPLYAEVVTKALEVDDLRTP